MAASGCAWLVTPDVRPGVSEAGNVAEFGNMPRRLARLVGARDPLKSVWVDDAKAHSPTLAVGGTRPHRVGDTGGAAQGCLSFSPV